MPGQKTDKQKLREIRQKQLDEMTGKAVRLVTATVAGRSPAVNSRFYREPSVIHPRHLVVCHVFRTDADWTMAKTNGLAQDIQLLTKEALVTAGYSPKEAAQISVHFMSDEGIQGNKNPQ
jgi:hypothetical protein